MLLGSIEFRVGFIRLMVVARVARVANRAAVANCFGLVVLCRTELQHNTFSGQWEPSLNVRHGHV